MCAPESSSVSLIASAEQPRSARSSVRKSGVEIGGTPSVSVLDGEPGKRGEMLLGEHDRAFA